MDPQAWGVHTHLRSLRDVSKEVKGTGKGLPQQAEVAQGVPDRLMHPIFLTFGTTRMVGRQPYAPAAFTTLQRGTGDIFRASPNTRRRKGVNIS